MYQVIKESQTSNFLKSRFTDAKRISQENEALSFYNDCLERLTNPLLWNYMSLLNQTYKVSVSDQFGIEAKRSFIKGDLIKISINSIYEEVKNLWLKVDGFSTYNESDYSEISTCIKLKFVKKQNPIINNLFIELGERCEIYLRKIMNTISVDVRLFDDKNITTKSYMNRLKWDMFIKNILVQL